MSDISIIEMKIDKIPTILWGETSEKIYIYVHGKSGCRHEVVLL